ncbi:MAG TPA: alpha/beta hydrolase [Steroidobacter sp.]|uniref:alpha/beta fold hydrolase n=1 Tax=Steroidobacter sp. TaxID=1978227 RepID=UPI002EDACBB6
MPIYSEHTYRSRDGLKLYYRDYPGDPSKVPVLCLHGLTRNCRDFEALALRIMPGRRVITPDFRGRGQSQYDSLWMNYHPMTYADDIWSLLREIGVDRVIAIGTSLGGLVIMLMAAVHAQTFAGVVLNDIGPEIDPVGAARIRSYAGRFPPPRSWDDAIEQMKYVFGEALPDFTDQQWQDFVRLSYSEDSTGSPKLEADPRIGDAIRTIQPPPGAVQGMWLAFNALKDTPTLAIRGALSDLLSTEVFERMQREHPRLQGVTIANRGHVPQLDEPQSRAALEQFLAQLP